MAGVHRTEGARALVRAGLEQQRLAAQTIQVRVGTIMEQLKRGHFEIEALLAGIPENADEMLEELAADLKATDWWHFWWD